MRAGTTQSDYLDAFFSSALGTLTVTQPASAQELSPGETIAVKGT